VISGDQLIGSAVHRLFFGLVWFGAWVSGCGLGKHYFSQLSENYLATPYVMDQVQFNLIAGREVSMYKFILTSLVCVSLWTPAQADILYGAVQYKNVTGRIGVNINKKGMIRGVHPDSPAARAGLAAGDVVEVVNGKPGDVWHIHGTPETYVNLMVRRGSSHFKVQVKRIDSHAIRHELDRENDQERQTASKDETA
jgi:predicted metalloprotease with PDZ domain